jgi:phage terminase large subunit GpA-like protein
MNQKSKHLFDFFFSKLRPPAKLVLSDWMEEHIRLPVGMSARPGKFRNWPYFKEIANSIGDTTVPRVTLVKGTRVGYTKGMAAAIGASAVTDPCPMILLVPTEDDARGYSVDEIDPLFEASPVLDEILIKGRSNGKSTLVRKSFRGGASLKILAAMAPRNLRRHDAKKLFCDEVDGMAITKEGDPTVLAERRTMAFPDRKIVKGSTPTDEEISQIEREYRESDQRVYMLPCPHCSERFELRWKLEDDFRELPKVPVGFITWPKDDLGRSVPSEAYAVCPSGCVIEERWKPWMVERGDWIITKPQVKGHHGYRLSTLISLLANAAWGILATEYLKAKRAGPVELQPFYNTALALPWKNSVRVVSVENLMQRVEGFGLYTDRKPIVPEWVVRIGVGTDVQDDRLESTVLGFPLTGAPAVLGHVIHYGNTLEDEVWEEYDKWRRFSKWDHPNGWKIGIDAVAIDSGGREGRTQRIYNYTQPRLAQRVFAIKGVPSITTAGGPRKNWQRAKKAKKGIRLFLISVDNLKTEVIEALGREPFRDDGATDELAIRVSETLEESWFEQATNEIRKIKYTQGRAVPFFEPKIKGARTEALDCLVYGWALRYCPAFKSIDVHERAARRPAPVPVVDLGEIPQATVVAPLRKKRSVADIAGALNG